MNDPNLNKTYMDMLKLKMKMAKDLSIRDKGNYVIVISCQKK